MNLKMLLRVADTAALVSVCAAASLLPFHANAVAVGTGLLALAGGFVAHDLWQLWSARHRFYDHRNNGARAGAGTAQRAMNRAVVTPHQSI